jgi:hypothetical protein
MVEGRGQCVSESYQNLQIFENGAVRNELTVGGRGKAAICY